MKRRSFLQLIGATVAGLSLLVQADKPVSGRYLLMHAKHKVVYAIVTNSQSEVLDGKNFVRLDVEDWHRYCFPCHELCDGYYTFSPPINSTWPTDRYVSICFEQSGVSPATTDKIIGADRVHL